MEAIDAEDSGPGIDTQHLPRLFDSFFTTKETGLGLPIARSIIDSTRWSHSSRRQVGHRRGQTYHRAAGKRLRVRIIERQTTGMCRERTSRRSTASQHQGMGAAKPALNGEGADQRAIVPCDWKKSGQPDEPLAGLGRVLTVEVAVSG
jgi:hypothetical protein